MKSINVECCVLGAGPAGFGVTSELIKHGVKDILVVDRNNVVGGLSRTKYYEGARFDIGPHHFLTKNNEVNKLWHDTLGADFIPVDRLTRIYYDNKFFKYPISIADALVKLGPVNSFVSIFSYLSAKLGKKKDPVTFEDWLILNFGRKLYETFFKTYTEKIWGIPCNQIGKEWAVQRIKGLNFSEVIYSALTRNKKQIKSLIDRFDYPVHGAGQMYEVMAEKLIDAGGRIMLGTIIKKINNIDYKIKSIEAVDNSGDTYEISANYFFDSIPLTHFFKLLSNKPAANIMRAVEELYFREHITVDILVDENDYFPDHWIYIHSPEVKMARISNYNNFSKAMVDNPNTTALSIEYFVMQTDDLWKMSDSELIELAISELTYMKLIPKEKILKSWVNRETEVYPTYFQGYQEPYKILQNELNKYINVQPIGRGGLYKYDNMDHSTYSGMLAARNYLNLNKSPYNLWDININTESQGEHKRKK